MNKQQEKQCPKCNTIFICNTENIMNCQCYSVQLSTETKAFLSKTNFDCLCKECLIKINAQVLHSKSFSFPSEKEELIESLHYYKENGRIVFTELYHLLRGHCCTNGCKHCVYGFKKKLKSLL